MVKIRHQKLHALLLLLCSCCCPRWLCKHYCLTNMVGAATTTTTTTTTVVTDRRHPYELERTFVSFGRVAFRPDDGARFLRKRPITRSGVSPVDSSTATTAPPTPRSTTTTAKTGAIDDSEQAKSPARRTFLRGILAGPFLSKGDQQKQSTTRQEMQVDAYEYTYKQQQQQQQQQQQESKQDENKVTATAAATNMELRLQGMTQPLIPMPIWEAAQGDEFIQRPDKLNELVKSGALLAEQDESNEWIDWKAISGSSSGNSNTNNNNDGDDILVWTGRACKKDRDYYGSQAPLVKTRSVVPLSVQDMVSLLLDSERVKTYNSWSLGREDCWIHHGNSNDDDSTKTTMPVNDEQHQRHITKIVKNRTQPPIGSKPMVSVTLLHARPWNDDGSWLVVSRAVGGTKFMTSVDQQSGRSDILMGVNLLRPVSANSCQLTAVTHMYSKAVPGMLAQRLGVKSAVKFVKDMRGIVDKNTPPPLESKVVPVE